MKDNYGREINYLRISLTQKCNLNCLYCGSEKPDTDELTVDEIEKIVRVFASLKITKVRLTGGEPLLREDICEIASRIKEIPEIKKIVVTTNGIGLSQKAEVLKQAGISAINISLDTLDRERYKKLTGRDSLLEVLSGIDKALEVGLHPVRINSVLIKGQNDDEAGDLINLARDKDVDVRFIELMPFSKAGENTDLVIKGEDIISQFDFLRPCKSKKENSVAEYYTADGFKGKIGFITPVSNKFCNSCNRIRLLSNGELKPCLGHNETFNLKQCLNDENALRETIIKAIFAKPKGHNFECAYGNLHAMNKIGG